MSKANPNPSLSETQRWFKSHLLDEPSSVDVALNSQGGVPGTERLGVYKEGYDVRIREALAEVYEAVRFVLGEPRFAVMAAEYAKRYHSRDYNLSRVGRHLPEFLKQSEYANGLPFIPDLARLEWLIADAFHSFHETPLVPADLAGISEERLLGARIIFQSGVAVCRSSWPVLDIWNARKTSRDKVDVNLVDRPQSLLVCRTGLQVRCELLESWQFEFLSSLLQGDTMDAASEKITSPPDDFSQVAALFSKLMAEGLLVRCETNS